MVVTHCLFQDSFQSTIPKFVANIPNSIFKFRVLGGGGEVHTPPTKEIFPQGRAKGIIYRISQI